MHPKPQAGVPDGLSESLARLRESLTASPAPTAEALARLWRGQTQLLSALPTRYGEVLEALLTRFESAALFGEESCSFSLEDLRAQLAAWLDKAARVIG